MHKYLKTILSLSMFLSGKNQSFIALRLKLQASVHEFKLGIPFKKARISSKGFLLHIDSYGKPRFTDNELYSSKGLT